MKREAIYYYAIKYKGNYFDIKKAIEINEPYINIKQTQNYLIIGDLDYPKEFYQLEYPPFIIFYKGNLALLKRKKISIVGSRIMSEYSINITRIIAKTLSKKYVIVSGMAKGTDGIAHRESNETIGILGNGIDIIYPNDNKDIYDSICTNGLLLSEFPEGVTPRKENFPFRNRLIAALGESIVVPAAREKGGTFITIDYALKLNKEIYVIPHPLGNIDGEGCNRLIQDGANVIYNLEILKNL